MNPMPVAKYEWCTHIWEDVTRYYLVKNESLIFKKKKKKNRDDKECLTSANIGCQLI